MQAPDIWIQFGEHIHQDFLDDYPDFVSGIADILRNFSAEQRQELHLFLKELLGADISPDEKLDTWWATEADIFVVTDQIDDFLKQIAKTVEDSLSSSN